MKEKMFREQVDSKTTRRMRNEFMSETEKKARSLSLTRLQVVLSVLVADPFVDRILEIYYMGKD